MQTYSEFRFQGPLDWNRALQRILNLKAKNIPPDPETVTYLSKSASNWITCACGQQCLIIPRYQDGCPKDDILQVLGSQFLSEIVAQEWQQALTTLDRIERRSSKIINEIYAQKPQ